MPKSEWRVQLSQHHDGYITAEEFERNQQQLAHNRTNAEGTVLSGPAREGLALLQGLLLCAKCGRLPDRSLSGQRRHLSTYECNWLRRDGLATKSCLSVRTVPARRRVTDQALKGTAAAELAWHLAALDSLESATRTSCVSGTCASSARATNALWQNAGTKRSTRPTGWWPRVSSSVGTRLW